MRTRARVLLVSGALGLVLPFGPLDAQPSILRGVDVYRSRHVATATLETEYATLLDSMGAAVADQDMEAVGAVLGRLARSIRDRGPLAYLDVSPIEYFHDDTTAWYVTFDVVDSADVHRLDFLAPPTGRFPDAAPLLERWRAFESAGWERRAFWRSGEPCPAHHCLFSFAHVELAPYAEELAVLAREHAELLERVITDGARPEDRATASFLLAHHPDARRVAEAMLGRLRDPSAAVRNNAMRVLAFMAREEGSDAVALAPVLDLVDGPSTTDRNKALAIVDALAEDPATHEGIIVGAGSHLVCLLALKQPNNHDFAYSILRKISGLDLEPRSVDAWARWLAPNVPEGPAPTSSSHPGGC